MEVSNSLFTALPHELQIGIMSFLKPKDLRLCERVCRLWKVFSNDSLLWHPHIQQKYGSRFLYSIGSPHPKSVWPLSHSIKSDSHHPIHMGESLFGKLFLHGSLLETRDFGGQTVGLFDLYRKETIPTPAFFKDNVFLQWTIFNKKHYVVVKQENGDVICSSFPFNDPREYKDISKPLKVLDNFLFYTNDVGSCLYGLNLESGSLIFEQEVNFPVIDIFCSEQHLVALHSNNTLSIFNASTLTKSFDITPLDFKAQKIFLNKNKLVITYAETYFQRIVKYEIWDLASQKLIRNGSKPSSKEFSEQLDVTENYLFIGCIEWGDIYQISLEDEKEDGICKVKVPHSDGLYTFIGVVENKLFYTLKEDLFFLDSSKNSVEQKVNLVPIPNDDFIMQQSAFNGRYLVEANYCKGIYLYDFLQPMRGSEKHFIPSIEDNRPSKKVKN